MMRSMFQLLREGVFYNRQIMFDQDTTREALLAQHRAILDALLARDPAGAQAAVESHLGYVERALQDHRSRAHNEKIARKRLEHGSAR